MSFRGFGCQREPGWPAIISAEWSAIAPHPGVSCVMLAVGSDDDVPFSWLPRLHVLQFYHQRRPMMGGQVWFAWLGVAAGWRFDLLPDIAELPSEDEP